MKKKTDQEKVFEYKAKIMHKWSCKIFRNLGENKEMMAWLFECMTKEPELFAYTTDPENRNFMKWALQDSMKTIKAYHDKIVAIEKKYKLPTETIGDPQD